MTPGLMISAPASGTGKTTVALGLLAALRARGVAVQPFKSGPDYIDPGFHRAASGRDSFNLDGWAMGPDMLAGLIAHGAGADLVVAEGSMGLLDGVAAPGATGNGASADMAELAGWPVVLVLDVSGQAQSAAASAVGFAALRPGMRLAGVILNRVASPRHEALVREGMARAGIAVLGALPRRADLTLPERHLGLVQAEESDLTRWLDEAGAFISAHCDIDALVAAADARALGAVSSNLMPPPGQRIALARDHAFSFIYPHLIESWRAQGVEIFPFSPLADEAPDPHADTCWLPGGYPELHAGALAAASRFMAGLRAFPGAVHGECGGYMVLGRALIDKAGIAHEMAGLLGLVTSYERRRMHLGYRLAQLDAPMPGFAAGIRLRGHEFHYSTVIEQPDAPLARVQDATGAEVAESGSYRGKVSGSYFHLIATA